jgi:hypothetical protein
MTPGRIKEIVEVGHTTTEEALVRHRKIPNLLFISLMIATLPIYAQQASTASPPASTPPSSSAAQPAASNPAPAAPSDETLKKAKAVGLHVETRKGEPVYCYEDANLGTRFTTKKCVNASQLDGLIAQRQATKDAATHGPMMGTSTR